MTKTDRLKHVWYNMIQRCNCKEGPNYKYYAGRGISVCDDWRDYESFREWALANGYDYDAPYGKCTLDRIDVDGNYCPDNCRWVDIATQNANRRIRNENGKYIKRVPPKHNGEMSMNEIVSNCLYNWMRESGVTLMDAASIFHVNPNTLANKIQCTSTWYYDEVVLVSEITGATLNELAGIS